MKHPLRTALLMLSGMIVAPSALAAIATQYPSDLGPPRGPPIEESLKRLRLGVL